MKELSSSRRRSQASTEKPLRFGLGEFENIDQDGTRSSLQDLRSLFLSIASRAKPELASDLEELLGVYSQIPLFCYPGDKKRRNTRNGGKRYAWSSHCRPKWTDIESAWQDYSSSATSNSSQPHFELRFDDYYDVQDRNGVWLVTFNMPAHTDPKIQQFILRVFDWSKKYGLNATWCRQFAYETLDLWSQSETYRKARFWWYTTAYVSSSQFGAHDKFVQLMRTFEPLPQEFVFKWTTLFPVQGFRGKEKNFITEKFREELDMFLDRCEQQAEQANLVRSVRKHTREHLRWLADFQVKQMGYKEICEAGRSLGGLSNQPRSYLNDDTKTVRQAINKLANVLELPLRAEPRKPGRRRKR